MTHAAETLAEFATGLKFEDIPADVVDYSKKLIADTVAASILGGRMPWSTAIREVALLGDPKGGASAIGVGRPTTASAAAFINGSYGHANDFDDFYAYGPLHPSQTVWVALPVAEEEGATGAEAIAALVVGYDVSVRIAEACFSHETHKERTLGVRGFHAQPVCGVLAAAAQTGRLMGLSADTTASAMGISGSYAGGLMQFMEEQADTKRFHFGKASQEGIVSAQLAAHGFRGPKSVLEGKKGLLNAVVGNWVSEKLTENLGTHFGIMSAFLKPIPTMGGNLGCYDAMSQIVEKNGIVAEDIASVTAELRSQFTGYSLGIGEQAIEDHYVPTDRYSAEMSLPYLLALVAVHGRDLTPRQFDEAERSNSRVLAVARRVEVQFPADIDAISRFDTFPMGRVTVRLNDGRTLTETVKVSLGDPRQPLSWDQVRAKFDTCADGALDADAIDEFFEIVRNLDKADSLDKLGQVLRRARITPWPGERF
ncbi:MAG: MmgE/PrpD family protein [Hyphomicrobiales bacterium]|nr:MmgE/PrpD family protein [Hyphomicrobiales bacterium]